MNEKILVGGNVHGDITSCRIESQALSVDRTSAWSLTKITNYASYDVCSKQIISHYSLPGFTGVVFLPAMLFIFALFVIAAIANS